MVISSSIDKLPAVVRTILDDLIEDASSSTKALQGICDGLFLDLSSRASIDQEVTLYYDAKNEFQRHLDSVIDTYQKGLIWNFACAGTGQTLPHTDKQSRKAHESLSLIDNKQLEIDLSIDNIASNIRHSYREELRELTLRLDEILPEGDIEDSTNPLDPSHIGHAFAFACQRNLDVNNKCLIIIFKQFERHIVSQLGQCYASANQRLIDAGVLPEIPERLMHPLPSQHNASDAMAAGQGRSQPGGNFTQNSGQTSAQNAAQTNFEQNSNIDLNQLAAAIESIKHNHSAPGEFQLPWVNYSDHLGPVMSTGDLLESVAAIHPDFEQHQQPAKPKGYIQKFMSILLAKKQPDEAVALNEADDKFINLVTMFFDFILDDENIADTIKLQISRLQIPILRLALRDQSFFSSQNHPGRALINCIASVGLEFDESKPADKDRTYKAIARITESINTQCASNDDIFSTPLSELRKIISQEKAKSERIESRTSEEEAGRSKLKIVHKTVKTLLQDKLQSVEVPEKLSDFLISDWQKVLTMTLLKHSESSSQWINARQTVDDLIWVCQEHTGTRSFKRINDFKSELVSRVEQGLSLIQMHQNNQTEILAYLEELLDLASKNSVSHLKSVKIEGSILEKALDKNNVVAKQTNTDSGEANTYSDLDYAFVKKAEAHAVGTWFVYKNAKTKQESRCKLSSILSDTDTYIFVNRFGFKVIEKSKKAFAHDLQKDLATTLDNSPAFDRTCYKINRNLKLASGG